MSESQALPSQVSAASRLERMLAHPGFQRVSALVLSTVGVICAVVIAAVFVNTGDSGRSISRAAAPRMMEILSTWMVVLMILVGGCLGLYLAVKGHRRALTRLLASSCAALSAGFGIFFALRLGWVSALKTMRVGEVETYLLVMLVMCSIALMAIWLFNTTNFLILFPKPVKLLETDFAEGSEQRLKRKWFGEWKRRWFTSPQFVALAAGVALIVLLDSVVDSLASEKWSDASYYFVCWLPFAIISAKQRLLGDEDRRAIRWVLLGQTVWLLLFLAGILLVYALLAARVLSFPNWNDSSTFIRSFFNVFFAGFVIVLMLTLAFSILYHGTLDPDLMIRRTWIVALFGLITGVLFVVIERLLAGLIASWFDISAVNALTVVGAITAGIVYPFRSWLDANVKAAIEHWRSTHAIADGVRRDAVVVFADLSGYTALTERDERAALIMAAIFHRDAQQIAKAHGGALIKTIGDAVMLRFSASEQAFNGTSELKRAFRSHVEAMSMTPLPIHAAIHRGEVVESPSGDLFGATVNVTARLMGAAGSDDIVASHAAIVGTSLSNQAQSMGERKFKNVELPVECFRLV